MTYICPRKEFVQGITQIFPIILVQETEQRNPSTKRDPLVFGRVRGGAAAGDITVELV